MCTDKFYQACTCDEIRKMFKSTFNLFLLKNYKNLLCFYQEYGTNCILHIMLILNNILQVYC